MKENQKNEFQSGEIVAEQIQLNNIQLTIQDEMRPIMGLPIRQNGLYQQQNNRQIIYLQEPRQNLVIVQTIASLEMEIKFRKSSKWFHGCNCVYCIFQVFALFLRSIIAFQNQRAIAAGVFFILITIVWLICIYISVQSIKHFKQKYMINYQIGMFMGLVFEIIGNILLFTQGGDNYTKVNYVILMLIQCAIIILLIKYARTLRQVMIELSAFRSTNGQNKNKAIIIN
ncbi:hypothetical protein pb186bvf_015418 [Paramecium bursaria]